MNVAVDATIQNQDVEMGLQDKFSTTQLLSTAAVSAVTGGAFGHLANKLDRTTPIEAEKVDDFTPALDRHDSKFPDADEVEWVRNNLTKENLDGFVAKYGKEEDILPEPLSPQKPAEVAAAITDDVNVVNPLGPRKRGMLEAPKRNLLGVSTPANSPTLHTENLAAIGDRFINTFDLIVRQGLPGRKANTLGIFNRKSGVIRLRKREELDILSHEAAHFTEEHYGKELLDLKTKHQAELLPFMYEEAKKLNSAGQLGEGYAEFFRMYMTNPQFAEKNAPNFLKDFEDFMGREHADVLTELQGVRDGYQNWLTAPSAEVIAKDIVNPSTSLGKSMQANFGSVEGAAETVSNMMSKSYTALIDDLHPIKQAVEHFQQVAKQAGRELSTRVADDGYKLARLTRDAASSGHMDIMHGVRNHQSLKREGPGIAEALEDAFRGEQWDDEMFAEFGGYLQSRVYKHWFESFRAGNIPNLPDKFQPGDHIRNIKEIEAKYPHFADAAGKVYQFNQNMWKKKFEGGLISKEVYENGLEVRDYVPMLRNRPDDVTGKGKPSTKNAGQVKKFEGSQRAVINPISSIIKDAYDTAEILARNDMIDALWRAAELAGPGGGKILEEVPTKQLKATNVGVKEVIKSALKKEGNVQDQMILRGALEQLEDDLDATVFRMGERSEGGDSIIYLWRDGERKALKVGDGEFGQQLYDSMMNMNKEQLSVFTQIMSIPTTLLRAGITTTAEFLGANFVRDQLAAWVLTEDFKPFVSGLRGVGDELMQTELSQIANATGMNTGGANVSALSQTRLRRDFKALERNGYKIKRFTSLRGFFELAEVTETGTRLGVFKNAFKRAKGDGLSDYEAGLEAAFASRDLIDFGRRGSRMLAARKLVPFLNATLQGLDKGARKLTAEGALKKTLKPLFSNKPREQLTAKEAKDLADAGKAWAKMSSLAVIGISQHALYADDPEYQEISEYIRATHWVYKSTDGDWVTVPKPFELGLVSNFIERSMEHVLQKDPTAYGAFIDGLHHTVIPGLNIPAVDLPFELWANKKRFGGGPIVPEQKLALPPHMQSAVYTSEFSKRLGKAVNVSPAIIDHVLTSTTGTHGRNFLSSSNKLMGDRVASDWTTTPITQRFIKNPARGSVSATKFWEMAKRNGGEYNIGSEEYRDLKGQPGAQEALANMRPTVKQFALMNNHFSADVKRLHPLRRAADSTRIIRNMIKEMVNNELVIGEGVKKFTPGQRQEVTRIFQRLQMLEMRNALHLLGEEGWAQKETIPEGPVLDELKASNPEIFEEFVARSEKKMVYSFDKLAAVWPEVQRRLDSEGADALLADLVTDARF